MKRILLGLLSVVLILVALGAAGFAGYRYGFNQGARSASNSDAQQVVPGFQFGPQRMPFHNFGNDEFQRGFGERGFIRMQPGMGFGFFAPLMFLVKVAFWALVIWAVYSLVARSGWRLVKTSSTASAVQPIPANSNDDNKPSDAV